MEYNASIPPVPLPLEIISLKGHHWDLKIQNSDSRAEAEIPSPSQLKLMEIRRTEWWTPCRAPNKCATGFQAHHCSCTKAIKWQQFHKQVRNGEVSLIGFDFVFRRNVRYAEVLANSAKCQWNLGAELCPDLLEEHLRGGYGTLAPCGTVMRALFSVLSLRAAPRSFFSEQFTKWAVLFLRAGRLTVFMRIMHFHKGI